jgi:uracil-DNA glycosylase family 4
MADATKILKNIAALVEDCTACPLSAGRIHGVPGAGNSNPAVMFIGEGPGQKENETGLPFVGAAGKFLDQMLASIQLSRDDVFIGNVVKCRPPGNRDPEPSEIETCTSLYLWAQIEAMRPQLIVTLGRHSMGLFLPPEIKISQVHGQPKRVKGRVILPLYHPAAALYNGGMRDTLMYDFKKIPLVLKKIAKSVS